MGPALQNAALPGPGRQGRPPLQNPIGKRCVGAGVPDGPNWAYTAFLAMCHCEGAPRPWQSVPPSPTECLPIAVRRGRCPHRPAGFCAGLSVNHRVIAKPVRTLAVAIRPQSLPCLKGGGPTEGWWRDSCGKESSAPQMSPAGHFLSAATESIQRTPPKPMVLDSLRGRGAECIGTFQPRE